MNKKELHGFGSIQRPASCHKVQDLPAREVVDSQRLSTIQNLDSTTIKFCSHLDGLGCHSSSHISDEPAVSVYLTSRMKHELAWYDIVPWIRFALT